MTFAQRKKEDLARRVHAMPDEAVLALAMDCFGWAAPSPDHVRLAVALHADLSDMVEGLLGKTPELVSGLVRCCDFVALEHPRKSTLGLGVGNPEVTPLSAAIEAKAWKSAGVILAHPGVNARELGEPGNLLSPTRPPLFLALPSRLRHQISYPPPDSPHGKVLSRLLGLGAHPLGDGSVSNSPLLLSLFGMLRVPKGKDAGFHMFWTRALVRNIPVSPLKMDFPDQSVSTAFARLFFRMEQEDKNHAAMPDGSHIRTLTRARALTGMDDALLSTWPDILLVWLIQEGLPMAYAEETLSTRPLARLFLEKKHLQHTLPLSIDCPARLRL